MKKILIFYGAYGGGHLSAAKAIKNCLDKNYPECETLMVDCVESVSYTHLTLPTNLWV